MTSRILQCVWIQLWLYIYSNYNCIFSSWGSYLIIFTMMWSFSKIFVFIVTETTSHFIFDLNVLNNFSVELPEYYELSLALHGLFGLDEEIKSLLELIHFWLEAFNNSDIILASLILSEAFLSLMEEHIINYCLICAFVVWVCVCECTHACVHVYVLPVRENLGFNMVNII